MEKIEVWEDYYFDQDVLKKSEETWNRVWIELAFILCRKTETLIISQGSHTNCSFFGWKALFQIFKFFAIHLHFESSAKASILLSISVECNHEMLAMSNALLSTARRIWECQGTMRRLLIFVISAFTLKIKALFIYELIAHSLQLV
jgi:hypothetical protein